jgi:DUF917 family protein
MRYAQGLLGGGGRNYIGNLLVLEKVRKEGKTKVSTTRVWAREGSEKAL